MKNNIIAIVQARQTSKRFKNKVLKKVGDLSIIQIINLRLKKSKLLNDVVFAIPENKANKNLKKHLEQNKLKFFCGSENNVLKRYYLCSKKFKANIIVRITADCPFVDSHLLDQMLSDFIKLKKIDYYSNIHPATYPDGLDIEIFNHSSLYKVYKNCNDDFGQEHVTPFFHTIDKIKCKNKFNKENLSKFRLTLDYKNDFILIKKIFREFNFNYNISILKNLKGKFLKNIFLKDKEKIKHLENKIKKSASLWDKAQNIIPSGNHLLSKNPRSYIDKIWPSYFKRAKGCQIEDLDGNKYLDFSTMGIGTNILGYSNNEVNKSVIKSIKDGNISTLNSYEEVYLAERILDLHPGLDMIRFAKTGGEANAIAIRLARAASGKDNVAICGYHGWHDWYLSVNLNKKDNLDSHLIKGLNISGVPKKLKNTSFSFTYGNFHELKNLIEKKNIGIVKMEVCRNTLPDIDFLKKVRNLANKKKIVLIFDECTTGFRKTFGGLYKSINVKPDVLVLGKALSNGYSLTAVLGKKEIMSSLDKSFVSSTFWTERTGYVAAIKTLELMEKYKSWKIIDNIGQKLQKNWRKIFSDLDIKVNGIPSLTNFTFNHEKNLEFKTFIIQEMLKHNILASNTFYASLPHKRADFKQYYSVLENSSKIIRQCILGDCIDNYLDYKNIIKPFKRFN